MGQPGRKRIVAWALQGDFDPTTTTSNTFELEWPRGSGLIRQFPEIDKAAWHTLEAARDKLHKSQTPLLDALVQALNKPNDVIVS